MHDGSVGAASDGRGVPSSATAAGATATGSCATGATATAEGATATAEGATRAGASAALGSTAPDAQSLVMPCCAAWACCCLPGAPLPHMQSPAASGGQMPLVHAA
eukprot:scaffold88308_cov48-Phaeocystis_antarctica.AAC.2